MATTESTPQRILIVGAGQAGGRAAEALRAAGYAGAVTLVGDEAEPPYERPALSKGVLLGTESEHSTLVHAREAWSGKGVELRTGVRVEAISPERRYAQLSDGARIEYSQLLLATGSRVRPMIGVDDTLEGVHYLRTLSDCRRLAKELLPGRRLVVIGGGFIGLEIASTALRKGLSVTVVERQPALLERALPGDIAVAVERMHRARGVDVRLGVGVAALRGPQRVSAVGLVDGSELPADLVVIGIGIIPNTELAESAGANSADGVVTDEYGRTDVPGLWAAGDVTSHYNPMLGRRLRLESWQNAQNQAIAVAKNMLGPLKPYAEVPWFWSEQHEVNIQMVGISEPMSETVWRGDPATGRAMAFSLKEGRIVCAAAFNAGGEIRFARKLIETRAIVEPAALADSSRKLKDLAADRAAAHVIA